jgi:hypothetical protein
VTQIHAAPFITNNNSQIGNEDAEDLRQMADRAETQNLSMPLLDKEGNLNMKIFELNSPTSDKDSLMQRLRSLNNNSNNSNMQSNDQKLAFAPSQFFAPSVKVYKERVRQ